MLSDSSDLHHMTHEGQEVRTTTDDTYRCVTLNVNSLRAYLKKPDALPTLLRETRATTLCLQEIKMSNDVEGLLLRKQSTKNNAKLLFDTFPYRYYNPCVTGNGLHGTAVFTLLPPTAIRTRIGDPTSDTQGRTLILEYPDHILVNTYVQQPGVCYSYKTARKNHFDALMSTLTGLTDNHKRPLLWVGDMNVAPRAIDGHPSLRGFPGFSKEEQLDFIRFRTKFDLIDVFEHQSGRTRSSKYTWFPHPRAAQDNIGLRLDHVLVSRSLLTKGDIRIRSLTHLSLHGSDHNPVMVTLDRSSPPNSATLTQMSRIDFPDLAASPLPQNETQMRALLNYLSDCVHDRPDTASTVQDVYTAASSKAPWDLSDSVIPYIPVRLPGLDTPRPTMLDSGSDVSTLTEDIVRCLDPKKYTVVQAPPVSLQSVDSSAVRPLDKRIRMFVELCDDTGNTISRFEWEFMILPKGIHDILFGIPLITYLRGVVDTRVSRFFFATHPDQRDSAVSSVPFTVKFARPPSANTVTSDATSNVAPLPRDTNEVCVTKDYFIDPGGEARVHASLLTPYPQPWPTHTESFGLVEHFPTDHHFRTARCLTQPFEVHTVQILNLTPQTIVIPKGTTVGVHRVLPVAEFDMLDMSDVVDLRPQTHHLPHRDDDSDRQQPRKRRLPHEDGSFKRQRRSPDRPPPSRTTLAASLAAGSSPTVDASLAAEISALETTLTNAGVNLDDTRKYVLETEGLLGYKRALKVLSTPDRLELFKQQDRSALRTTTSFRARIGKVNTPPFVRPGTRHGKPQRDLMRKMTEELLKDGKVRPSESPWSSPILLVPKQGTSEPRVVQDFRHLNEHTEMYAYQLPAIPELLDTLAGSQWYSTIDLRSAFHLVPLHDDDIPKTAFSVPDFGHFEWTVLCMGLKNSSAIFQHWIHTILGHLRFECALSYLDDLNIYSHSFEQHLDDVGRVLDRLRANNLEVKASKCHFFTKRVPFLGHLVTPGGISINPDRIAAVSNMAPPADSKSLSAFIGMSGYYRNYMRDYARIIQPLRDILTSGAPFTGVFTSEQQRAFDTIRTLMTSDPILCHPDWTKKWEIHCDGCSHGLGAVLVNVDNDGTEHTVAYASRTTTATEKRYDQYKLELLALHWAIQTFRPYVALTAFTVVTDNSAIRHVKLKPSPNGIIARWIMDIQQYEYKVRQRPATSHTNADGLSRCPQCTVHTPANCSAVAVQPSLPANPSSSWLYRSVTALASLVTTPLASLVAGPALTRAKAKMVSIPHSSNEPPPPVQAPQKPPPPVQNPQMAPLPPLTAHEPLTPEDLASIDLFWQKHDTFNADQAEKAIQDTLSRISASKPIDTLELTWDNFSAHQAADPDVSRMLTRWLELHALSPAERSDIFQRTRSLKRLKKDDQPTLTRSFDEVLYTLYKVEQPPNHPKVLHFVQNPLSPKLVVPQALVPSVLRHFHGNPVLGHPGRNRMLAQVRSLFRWKGMSSSVRRWVRSCTLCARRKPPRPLRAGLTSPMRATHPMEFIHIDHVGPLPPTANGDTHLFTVCDQFTRFVWAFPCKRQDTGTCLELLMKYVVFPFGCPKWIWSDRAPAFASHAMAHICNRFGIKKAQTTGYQPQSNASLERFHSYMNRALTFVCNKHKNDWDKWIDAVLFTYRITTNETTRFSPFFLMYGREPRIPLSAMLGVDPESRSNTEQEYSLHLSEALHEAYEHARFLQSRARERAKQTRDQHRHEASSILQGSWVMLWEPTHTKTQSATGAPSHGPQKLEFTYSGPHSVYHCPPTQPHFRYIVHVGRQKILKVNVNRLRLWHPWSDEHLFTDPPMENTIDLTEVDVTTLSKEGDLILIPNSAPDEPFLIARILQRRDTHQNGHLVQLFSNLYGYTFDTYRPGWVDPKDNKCYFRKKPTAPSHKPYTNDVTSRRVSDKDIHPITITLTENDKLPQSLYDRLSNDRQMVPDLALVNTR
jgi:exodeoxyribonuclease III